MSIENVEVGHTRYFTAMRISNPREEVCVKFDDLGLNNKTGCYESSFHIEGETQSFCSRLSLFHIPPRARSVVEIRETFDLAFLSRHDINILSMKFLEEDTL